MTILNQNGRWPWGAPLFGSHYASRYAVGPKYEILRNVGPTEKKLLQQWWVAEPLKISLHKRNGSYCWDRELGETSRSLQLRYKYIPWITLFPNAQTQQLALQTIPSFSSRLLLHLHLQVLIVILAKNMGTQQSTDQADLSMKIVLHGPHPVGDSGAPISWCSRPCGSPSPVITPWLKIWKHHVIPGRGRIENWIAERNTWCIYYNNNNNNK